MSASPLRVCPQCGKELRRLINGGIGTIFKGSGFYVTDKKGSGSTSGPAKVKAPSDKPAATATSNAASGAVSGVKHDGATSGASSSAASGGGSDVKTTEKAAG
jgi:hypothetical protein